MQPKDPLPSEAASQSFQDVHFRANKSYTSYVFVMNEQPKLPKRVSRLLPAAVNPLSQL
jgi:hypothetical protein